MGIVRNKMSIDDLKECFNQLAEFNSGDRDVIMFHPVTRKYKVLPVALEFDDVDHVWGDPFITFKQYVTITGGKVWKLETEIDIVSKY
jgi:hypothetical protein